VTVAVIGAGHRSRAYCQFALRHPDLMKVVAVADPHRERRDAFADQHGIAPDRRFDSYHDLVRQPRLADAVINGTMDHLHYESSMPVIALGYHLLLEKPIAPTEREVRELIRAAREQRVTVMICHVLRYAPFYQRVKAELDAGRIGRIVALHTAERVSYHHMATAFVRGKWNRADTSNPILLAKCCHDLDILAWLMSPQQPRQVASVGGLSMFRPDRAPEGSTDRCLNGCQVEATCPYSARRMYVEANFGFGYPWEHEVRPATLTTQQKLDSLRQGNPYGRCVWRCDNDVFDHQSLVVQFDNGVTATHDLFGATSRPTRTIHVLGEAGELEGDFERSIIQVRRHDPASREPAGYQEQTINLRIDGGGGQGGHGGGDSRLIDDFIRTLRGEPPSPGATRIEDSLAGHLIAFAAEASVRQRQMITIA
jgi:predicted dehydrogenase